LLRPNGDLARILVDEPAPSASRPLPDAVWQGVAAAVAARAAEPLALFVESGARAVSLEWGPVARDVVQIGRGRIRLSDRLRDALRAGLSSAPTAGDRAALGLAVIAEMAALVGDALRARAQAEILRLARTERPPTLDDPSAAGGRGGDARARDIAAAVEALLEDATG
jgi:hypothetical protein